MEIFVDDLQGPEIKTLLEAHLDTMRSLSPPDSVHALDLSDLRKAEITFWTVRDEGVLVGCGALKELPNQQGEIKSMHVPTAFRGRGIAAKLLNHIIDTAKARGYTRLSLETGTMDGFLPAREMYNRHGFNTCPPFGNYFDDPNSICMTLIF